MPRIRSCVRLGGAVTLLSVGLMLLTLLKNPDINRKLDDVKIGDLQAHTYGRQLNATKETPKTVLLMSANDTKAIKEFVTTFRPPVEENIPVQNLPFIEHISLWDTKSVDEVLPNKFVKITGTQRTKKGFLTIGIPTIRRPSGTETTYLSDTLKSLITNCSPEDKERMVILIFLADFDQKYKNDIQTQIGKLYEPYLKSGLIQVMEVHRNAYPKLKDLKQNFKDDKKRVSWRSKQVIDFAYMFYFSRNLSDYYLQLEDDVISAPNYLIEIERYVQQQKQPWVSLQFSILGFIGKLFHSSDLEQLARFLKLFYQEMPVDWLYPIFAKLLSYPKIPVRKPTLFQHMGKVSSLDIKGKQKLNLLKDKFFKSKTDDAGHALGKPTNPTASLYTTINTYHANKPSDAYVNNNKKYFWGQEPNLNDTFTIVFATSHHLKAIKIETGHPEKGNDFMRSGDILYGTAAKDRPTRDGGLCDGQYETLGSLVGGSIVVTDLEETVRKPVDCVRLLVTGAQIEWVIISNVSVWTIS